MTMLQILKLRKKVNDTMMFSCDYDVEEGYEECIGVSYKKRNN